MKKQVLIFLIVVFCSPVAAQTNTVFESITYLKKHSLSPSDYLLKKFSMHSVILLAEEHAIENNLAFVKEMIPRLYRAGVTNLGMEFGSFEKQGIVDSLMNAPSYNEQMIRDIMYFHNAGWPYEDYLNVYKAIWRFNRTLNKDQKQFRVVHLSYQYDWKDFKGEITPDKRKKVFSRGGDEFWAKRLKEEVILKKEKILCLVGIPHALTRFHQSHVDEQGNCRFDTIQFGQHLYREFSGEIYSVLLHVPLPGNRGYEGNGAIEQVMHNLDNRPAGFDLAGTPMGLITEPSFTDRCQPVVQLKDLFDGYIFLAPYAKLRGASIDPSFYEGRSWEETLSRQPDPYWFRANTAEELLQNRRDYANLSLRYRTVLDKPGLPKVSSGTIQRFEHFPSKLIRPRNIDVWLPEGYSIEKKYSVLYMHDGQMLFDSTMTWNGKAWDVDDAAEKLLKTGAIRDMVVVALWNTGDARFSEYFPAKAMELIPKSKRDSILQSARADGASIFSEPIQSDNYLRFIVEELKPFIDRTFSTKPDRANTFISGSSMGGLISMYAICEFPDIFGGAACLSTHWPGSFTLKNNPIPAAFLSYLQLHLPDPATHMFYFDCGDQTLDALYPSIQKKVDEVMRRKGSSGSNWQTLYFPGDAHAEDAWRRRLTTPLKFLFSR